MRLCNNSLGMKACAQCPPGVGPGLRRAAAKLKQKKVIEERGGVCCIKTISVLKNYTCSFRVGHQFDEFTKGLDNQRLKVCDMTVDMSVVIEILGPVFQKI